MGSVMRLKAWPKRMADKAVRPEVKGQEPQKRQAQTKRKGYKRLGEVKE